MTDRERLIKLLCEAHNISTEAACFEDMTYAGQLRMEADHLIANGVTFAADNPVGDKFAKDTNVLTNADRVRSMSDDDLAYWIMCPYDSPYCNENDQNCIECTKEWLQQPAEG